MKQHTNPKIQVGRTVTHSSVYGMGLSVGYVIAEAGNRYGRRYVWVNYTVESSQKTFNSAFWDAVLTPSTRKAIVLPPTTPNNNKHLWDT